MILNAPGVRNEQLRAAGPPAVLALLAVLLLSPVATANADARSREAPETIPGQYIVTYERSVDAPSAKTSGLERTKGFKSRHRYGRALKGFSAKLSPSQVRGLRADPQVELVVPDRPVKASANIPLASGDEAPAGVRRIDAATSTSVRAKSGANVAVIDTGVDLAHRDLNAASGKNCVTSGAAASDDHGHGTHVAGTIAARNDGTGVTGVAPGTQVFAAKVLDGRGSGTMSQVICGIDWVTSTRSDADPDNDIAVANMSLGGPGAPVGSCATTNDPEHRAICASVAAGVTYVVAAGNDGWDFDYASQPDTPAAYPEVLTVTAMGDSDGKAGGTGAAPGCRTGEADDRYASFSNFAATAAGRAHTVAAPGVCIKSTVPGGGHGVQSGTSMASPHIAGAVALCFDEDGQQGPCAGLSPGQVSEKVRADAASRTTEQPTYGFSGDPTRPVSGAYFGHLAWAGTEIADNQAPTVGSVTPTDASLGVAPSTVVSVSFSETMDRSSAEQAFRLTRSDGTPVGGSFSWSGNTMSFRPSTSLPQGTHHSAKVAAAARDAAGNPLGTDKAWSFKTLTSAAAFPSAITMQAGTVRSGGYARLGADDNSFFSANSTTSGTRTTAWYGRIVGVSNDLRNLKVAYRSRSSVTCNQTVAIWRWTTNSWVALDSRSVSTSEVLVDRAPGGTLADYVSGTSGDGEVRVQVRCTRGSSFYTQGDLMRVSYDRL